MTDLSPSSLIIKFLFPMKMDLLPRPLGSFTPDVDVPLMEIIPYEEPQDFFSFPQRHNIQFSLYDEKDSHALAILIQSWLFFGLLTESFGDMPELSDLVDTRPVNGKPISCVSLRIYASRIYDEQLSTRLRKAKFQEMIRFAHSQLIHFEKLPCAVQTPVPAVALSTHLLLESLVALSRAIQTHEGLTISSKYLVLDLLWGGRSQFQAPVTSQDVPPSLQLVLDRLFANKWCRAQAKLHFQKFGYMPLYYMSSIHRRHLQEMDHETCRDNICSATTPSDKSLGVPRHRWSRCDCLLQSLPVDQLLNILRQGKIPLVRLTYNQLGRLTLTLEAATTRSRYIAISHVWADGLGNATGNSVYYCQLEQIQRQLSNLPVYDEGVFLAMHTGLFNFDFSRMKFSIGLPDHTSTLFWLDILCIPAKCLSGVQDTDVRRLRKKAVSQIPTVFAGAAQVLVLDAELQTLRLSASQLPEIFAQIIGCNWAKRAWTYQEGAHSLRCRVQLADGAINPLDPSLRSRSWKGFGYQFDDGLATNSSSDMIKLTIRSLLEHDLYCAFKTEISLWFPDNDIDGIPTALDEGPDSEAMTLVRTWNELLLRSTTEASDLVIILAMALRIPLRSLLELPISKRLPSILWSLTQIPLSLLYIPYTEDADSVDRQNTWVLRHIQAPSPRGIYPLAARDYGSFSEGRDCISFNLGTQSDLWLISLAGDMSRVPLLLVKTPLHLYKILFHRQEIAAADVSYSFGKLIVIDPRSAAAESQQFKEPWKAGCSFIIREAHQIGSDAWKLNVIYDSAISALVLDPESEGRGGTYPAQSLSDALAQNIVQQPIHDATDQSSWASSRETSLEICMACSK